MNIRFKKGQETTKGGFLSGPMLRLTLEASVELSDEDRALVARYGDTQLTTYGLQRYFDGTESQWKVIKFERINQPGRFSEFRIAAYVDGSGLLGNIEELESTVVRALTREINRLRNLAAWDGTTVLTDSEFEQEHVKELGSE